MDRWALHGPIRSVSEYQYYTILSQCYLTSGVSTPLFIHCSIIARDGRASTEMLLIRLTIKELIPSCAVGR